MLILGASGLEAIAVALPVFPVAIIFAVLALIAWIFASFVPDITVSIVWFPVLYFAAALIFHLTYAIGILVQYGWRTKK